MEIQAAIVLLRLADLRLAQMLLMQLHIAEARSTLSLTVMTRLPRARCVKSSQSSSVLSVCYSYDYTYLARDSCFANRPIPLLTQP